MNNWASLGRVSSDEQFEEGESYENQLKFNRELAFKNNGTIYKEYKEEGVSAYKKRVHQRKVMVELLEDIMQGHIQHIAAFKRDRICRDPEDYYFLRKIFSKAGVKVHLTCGTEKWGDPLTNSPTDELMDGLLPLLAKFESMTTAQRVRSAVQEAVKRGEWRNGRPPYGYQYDKTTKKVTPVPHQVEICKLIRSLYIQGHGSGKIAALLNNTYKIPYESPAANWTKHNKKKRDYWYEGVITSIVAKPVYMGIQVWGNEWYECPAIEPIFTKEEWEEANKIYLSKHTKVTPHKYFNSTFLYKGVLYCAYCNEKMIPTYKTHKYTKDDGTVSLYEYYAYKCSGRWDKFNGCKARKHSRDKLENAILLLVSDKIDDVDTDTIYKTLMDKLSNEVKLYNTKVTQLNNDITNLQKTLDQYVNAFIDAPPQSAIRKQIENKMESVQKELEEVQKQLEHSRINPPKQEIEKNQIITIYNGMRKWGGIMNNPVIGRDAKRKLALEIIDKIVLDNEGNIDITLKLNTGVIRKPNEAL